PFSCACSLVSSSLISLASGSPCERRPGILGAAVAIHGLLAPDAQRRPRQRGESRRADGFFTLGADSVGAFLDTPQRRTRFPQLDGHSFETPHGDLALGSPKHAVDLIATSIDEDCVTPPRRATQFS